MYKIGYGEPGDMGEYLTTEYNEDTGMVVDIAYREFHDDYIAGFYHEDVGLVTYFLADSIEDIRAELEGL